MKTIKLDEIDYALEFFTPAELVNKLLVMAEIDSGDLVLEPSAGNGSIALKARDLGAEVLCFEIQHHWAKHLKKEGFFCVEDDFLNWEPIFFKPFDAVVMNPPFTGGQDVEHITHALKFLKQGGILVSVASASIDSKYSTFRMLVDKFDGTIEQLPPGSFSESGTESNSVVVKIHKE